MNECKPLSLGVHERVASRLRLTEKRLINATTNAVRKRLAPIRGIPTKQVGLLLLLLLLLPLLPPPSPKPANRRESAIE
jgi:hypothetical protein